MLQLVGGRSLARILLSLVEGFKTVCADMCTCAGSSGTGVLLDW